MRRPDRVLVVDDQDIICEVLRTLLRREGFDVQTCGSGEAALDFVAKNAYEVVLCDKNLPGISGLEVLDKARALRPELEIIMITGYASLDSALSALRRGAYDYLVKPFADLGEVAAKVRKAAEKVHLLRENQRLTADLRARNQLLEQTVGELRQTRQQAIDAARLAALGDAAGRLLHELKHPLASLTARLQLLRSQAPGAEAAIDAALADVQRSQQVLSDFFDYAHPRPMAPEPCDLSQIVREVGGELLPIAQTRGTRLQLSLPAAAEPLVLDAARIRQVVRNLVRNALDATPRGGVVELCVAAQPDEVELSVSDTGPGIPLEAQARIGTPFFTTKSGGTGLGLALSRRIAEDHGGRLELTNRDGGGACARVVLPRRRADPV